MSLINLFEYGNNATYQNKFDFISEYLIDSKEYEYPTLLTKIHEDANEYFKNPEDAIKNETLLIKHLNVMIDENKIIKKEKEKEIIKNVLNVHKGQENELTKLINMYPTKLWDYDVLSQNPNITWEIVKANPQIK